MPLSCDCYGGCWSVHSRDWPSIPCTEARSLYCRDKLPYGTYVHTWTKRDASIIRIETEELAMLVLMSA